MVLFTSGENDERDAERPLYDPSGVFEVAVEVDLNLRLNGQTLKWNAVDPSRTPEGYAFAHYEVWRREIAQGKARDLDTWCSITTETLRWCRFTTYSTSYTFIPPVKLIRDHSDFEYDLRVRAVYQEQQGEEVMYSPFSGTFVYRYPPRIGEAPANVRFKLTKGGGTLGNLNNLSARVKISWDAPATPQGQTLKGYKVESRSIIHSVRNGFQPRGEPDLAGIRPLLLGAAVHHRQQEDHGHRPRERAVHADAELRVRHHGGVQLRQVEPALGDPARDAGQHGQLPAHVHAVRGA